MMRLLLVTLSLACALAGQNNPQATVTRVASTNCPAPLFQGDVTVTAYVEEVFATREANPRGPIYRITTAGFLALQVQSYTPQRIGSLAGCDLMIDPVVVVYVPTATNFDPRWCRVLWLWKPYHYYGLPRFDLLTQMVYVRWPGPRLVGMSDVYRVQYSR